MSGQGAGEARAHQRRRTSRSANASSDDAEERRRRDECRHKLPPQPCDLFALAAPDDLAEWYPHSSVPVSHSPKGVSYRFIPTPEGWSETTPSVSHTTTEGDGAMVSRRAAKRPINGKPDEYPYLRTQMPLAHPTLVHVSWHLRALVPRRGAFHPSVLKELEELYPWTPSHIRVMLEDMVNTQTGLALICGHCYMASYSPDSATGGYTYSHVLPPDAIEQFRQEFNRRHDEEGRIERVSATPTPAPTPGPTPAPALSDRAQFQATKEITDTMVARMTPTPQPTSVQHGKQDRYRQQLLDWLDTINGA